MSQPIFQHDEQGSVLGPPRFTLRGLMLAITALGCLFGLMTAVGVFWSAILLFFLSLILGHVLGNALGTTLRDRSSRQVRVDARAPRDGVATPVLPQVAAPQRLTRRAQLHRITLWMAIVGGVGGGALGGIELSSIHPDAGAAAIGLGVVSSAVLGAFAGFTISSFISVARQAMREALGESHSAGHCLGPHENSANCLNASVKMKL